MIGKVSQRSSILPPAFVESLQKQARGYAVLEHLKSRREWLFGECVNCEWEKLDADVKAEITKEQYYVECSYWINAAVPFPIVSASGETLRRWCDVTASYQGLPGLEAMKDALSFDHFSKARRLARKGKVSVPAFALAKAVEQSYTADEMVQHFDPPETPNEYDRVNGWLDGLQTASFEWLERDKRERLVSLLKEIRSLLGI